MLAVKEPKPSTTIEETSVPTTNTDVRAKATSAPIWNDSLRELLCAAAINSSFRTLLLSNPTAALKKGFAGKPFGLSPNDSALLSTIRASSLEEFVSLFEARKHQQG